MFWILNDKYERKTLVRDSTNSCTNRLLDNKNTLLQVSWFYFDSTFPRQLFRNYGRSDSTKPQDASTNSITLMMILIFDFECPKKSRNVVNSVIDTRRTSNITSILNRTRTLYKEAT